MMKAAIREAEVVCLSDIQSISNINSIFDLEKKTEEIHRRLWILFPSPEYRCGEVGRSKTLVHVGKQGLGFRPPAPYSLID